MALPFLPGLSPYSNSNIGREDFRKSQKFTFYNKQRYEQSDSACKNKSCFARGDVHSFTSKPSWEAFDKRVLAFEAYLLEPIYQVSPSETYRARKFKIHYFLENDTMEMTEPHQRNSGILQGILFKRCRFKKPSMSSGKDAEYYTLFDLNLNATLEINGYLFKITNCDPFTRTFLTELGITVNEPVSEHLDPYDKQRKTMDDNPRGLIPRFKEKDKLGPFLKYDGMHLTFYCCWEENDILGSARKMELHYFLSDDAIEIVEKRLPNSGRSDTTMFLKRTKLPKTAHHLLAPWGKLDKKLIAIVGTTAHCQNYSLDSNPLQENLVEPEYYTDEDFDLGHNITVYGRKFFIYDCDSFTRKFYRTKYGRELKSPVPVSETMQPIQIREVLPKEPVGSYEKTVLNCFTLHHKRQFKNWPEYFSEDKYGWKMGELKFSATLLSEDSIEKSRKFVLTYFLSDNTIAVQESRQINSGIREGKYIKRNHMPRPVEAEFTTTKEPSYYRVEDLFVGNILHLSGKDFLLTAADEVTLRYFENNCNMFPYSDIKEIFKNLKNKLANYSDLLESYFQSVDANHTGLVPFDMFRKTILENIKKEISEHEIITLSRHYALEEDVCVPLHDIITAAQKELRKKDFKDFKEINLAMKAYDLEQTGYFEKEQLYRHLRGVGIPLSSDILKLLITSFTCTEDGRINYIDFLFALDYFNNSVCLSSEVPFIANINWANITKAKSVEKIDYVAFIKDLRN